ncbi:MAG: hypothetical protein DKM50_08500 [Candidatus Margulisiibacteriota bacterium]|nr:MAG: hypothetical protein A2X43_11945 [Candidatus Margulisbacteria bacterium GWD2_39_127]OGI01851.1 MAG: hypothetical protein A2X42_04470 [Candidatus Margulisbacteria bacterium GWF2_38_17]OGI10173.1 MAG: hypothetical protein A2X41_01190 [Candidatus Margulisbacteria bacterium GWE2_39_32]PZM79490.1 MAG: hypothetical protein DKM50_08500 [Candidatus Margulisiibacteriota bacterium]HAR63839.1 hypothetical protein [Candidatus Margulisiibacteriota bacterium]
MIISRKVIWLKILFILVFIFLLYQLLLFGWSNYDSIKPLDLKEYITTLFRDFKLHFNRYSLLWYFINPIIISLAVIEGYFIQLKKIFLIEEKLDCNNYLLLKILLVLLVITVIIYLLGPFSFLIIMPLFAVSFITVNIIIFLAFCIKKCFKLKK